MLCKILKSFPGSQDGSTVQQFIAGTEAELSDYLMSAAEPSWFERVSAPPEPADEIAKDSAIDPIAPPVIENKAVTTDGKGGKKKSGEAK